MSTRWKSKKTTAVRFMPVRAHKKNCGNRLQSCNKYNVSSFALGHKEIARGRAWSLPIHLARRGFPTVTRKQTRKNRHNWQLSWHHSAHNLLLSTHWSAAEDDDSSSCSKFLRKVQFCIFLITTWFFIFPQTGYKWILSLSTWHGKHVLICLSLVCASIRRKSWKWKKVGIRLCTKCKKLFITIVNLY